MSTTEPTTALTPSQQATDAAKLIEKWRSERRIRLAVLPSEWIRFLVIAGVKWDEPDMKLGLFRFPQARGLPDDAVPIGVVWAPDRDCLLIAFASSTFEPVPEGLSAPIMEQPPVWVVRQVQIEKAPEEVEAEPALSPKEAGSILVLALVTALAIATAFGVFPWWS